MFQNKQAICSLFTERLAKYTFDLYDLSLLDVLTTQFPILDAIALGKGLEQLTKT